MPYKRKHYSKKARKGGADEDDELSSIHGDENFDLDDSTLSIPDFDQINESQNTTTETMPPFDLNESASDLDQSQGSLHLSDLDTSVAIADTSNDSVNTTQESIGGKTKKRKGKGKTIKKRKGKGKTIKKIKGKGKTMKKGKRKTSKKGGQEDNLTLSIQQSEKQILPKDENPAL